MESIKGFISSEMRFPNVGSLKKKRYVVFNCPTCGNTDEKVYIKSQFVNECTHCSKGGFTTADFIKRGIEHFGDLYGYSLVKYVNKRTSVTIICPTHGEFTQRAQEHLDGHGCNLCKFDAKKVNQLLSKDVWLSRIASYQLLSFKDESQIKNYHGIVDLVCRVHGEFTVQLGQIGTAKFVCNHCAGFNHQRQSIKRELIGKLATIYYVYLPNVDMYKLGVTVDIAGRLRCFKGCKLLQSWEVEYTEALRIEHKVHAELEHLRYNGIDKLIPSGSTELYKTDILGYVSRALQG